METSDITLLMGSTSSANKTKIATALGYVTGCVNGSITTSNAENVKNIQVSHIDTSSGLYIFEIATGIVVSINLGTTITTGS